MTDLDIVTGEIVGVGRMTPAQAADWSTWVRDLMTSVLVEGQDYGVIVKGQKPTMFKSGGEMLLRAAGLGFTIERIDDQAARDHLGVTYRCTVVRPDGSTVATCDGYCGHEEPGRRGVLWNTIVKMAQKRAMVGAALNATASSGLFNADLDDDEPPSTASEANDDLLTSNDDRGHLKYSIEQLSDQATDWLTATAKADIVRVDGRRQVGIPNIDGPKFRRSHRDRLAWHILVAQRIKPARQPEGPDPEAA